MNTSQPTASRLAAALLVAAFPATVTSAGEVVKANNSTSLNNTGSWINGATPTASDTVVFDDSISADLSVSPGGNLSWGQLRVAGTKGNVTVNQNTTTNTITIGQSTIGQTIVDMSGTGGNFTFNTGIVRLASAVTGQVSFNVGAGRTLTIGQLTNQSNTKTLSFVGGGNVVLNGNSGTGGVLGFNVNGAHVTMNGATNAFAGATITSGSLTVNSSTLTIGNLALNGGTFSIVEAGVGALTLSADRNFTMSGGTWSVSFNGGNSDEIIGSGSGIFNITGGTLALDGVTDYGVSYTLLSGFASGSIDGLHITGYDTANWIASLDDTGVLSFTAVPEPSAFAALAGLGALGCGALRRRARV